MNKKIPEKLTGNAIRQTFIDYFVELKHTFVPSSSLVPGGDSTLLFTNSGMVQFKDVFLGTDKRPYTRAVNSQKSMRVAGKHNDLDDVGRDDTHHTFFEMLGNWSFGDYYKKEAIEWAWYLLTEIWGLPEEQLYATCFQDELGDIPTDEEAANHWRNQPGFDPTHLYYFGRKDNFWEMAETGPCGPNSEVHIDLRPEEGPVSYEDFESGRLLELWNLVFIQYNRIDTNTLESLPATHVDTGLGFERIVAILQGVDSNYRTDLLWPLILETQKIAGHSEEEREANFTPYRVIADHARAAAFLIADGVTPGNLGRNYVTRMVIRRAYRFGGKIGLTGPFLAKIATVVIENYGGAYPELLQNRTTILKTITREEEQFQRTLDRATTQLENLLNDLEADQKTTLPGNQAADLYTTHGMPFEITRDIARERGFEADEKGFIDAMETHRLASGAGSAMGVMGAEDTDFFNNLLKDLQNEGKLSSEGVIYDPYHRLNLQVEILAIVRDGQTVNFASTGDHLEVVIPETPFYIEAGGQVDDTGTITGDDWEISIHGLRRPAAGIITHVGEVVHGTLRVGDVANIRVDGNRRMDIMRNHTATHLLHAALHKILGDHARQAGSLVAPDRLRFDFTHPEALTVDQLDQIENFVNEKIFDNYSLDITFKPLQQAKEEGAIALFGEKYSETVRTIRIGGFSYELCGGTHVSETNDIGLFIITNEGSAAAGIRRIEAITGREAYRHTHHQRKILNETAQILGSNPDKIIEKAISLVENLNETQKEITVLRNNLASAQFKRILDKTTHVNGVEVLTATINDASANTLRQMADRFRERYPTNGVAVLATVKQERPIIIAAVTKDLTERGLHAGQLVNLIAKQLGGGGGGKPTLAQAGGKDARKLGESLEMVPNWVKENLH